MPPAPTSFSERVLRNRLKFNHLAFLIAIQEEVSLAKAAVRVGISQPAATKLLREVERILGVRLFDRSRHGVVLTEHGALVLPAARRILSELRRLGGEMNALTAGLSGHVLLGALISASSTLIPLSVAELSRTHPGISIRIFETTEDVLLPMLENGDLDLILGRVPRITQRNFLCVEELYREPFCVVARPNHPLHEARDSFLERFAEARWVLPPLKTMTRAQVEEGLLSKGLPAPMVVAESSSTLVNLRLVQTSDVLSAVPLKLAEAYAGMGALSLITEVGNFPDDVIGMTTHADRPLTSAALVFSSIAKRVAAKIRDDLH